jgi:hypothetical protein
MRTYGGDIHAKSVFEKILSIGYEMETTDLTKLTLTSDGIFLNTDTARKDIAKINDPDLSEDDPEFDDYTLRQEELIAEFNRLLEQSKLLQQTMNTPDKVHKEI